jgi:polyphenol oxidase
MKLVERKNCLIINEVFPQEVIAGFTTKEFSGTADAHAYERLLFLERPPEVSFMDQVHSACLHTVTTSGVYKGDGLFTAEVNHLLAVKTADCLPLFFFNRLSSMVGVIHMGWRSARLGILESISGDLSGAVVVAGVGLRNCCYEVGAEFWQYDNFRAHLSSRHGRIYFDPVAFARETLVRKGMSRENFHDINFCSFCMDAGFSYRKNATKERNISFIMRR